MYLSEGDEDCRESCGVQERHTEQLPPEESYAASDDGFGRLCGVRCRVLAFVRREMSNLSVCEESDVGFCEGCGVQERHAE